MIRALIVALFVSASAFAAPVHIDLEAPSFVYREHLARKVKMKNEKPDHPAIAKALAWGDRLAKWLELENSRRDQTRQLRLTSQATRRGIPIDAPSVYSEKTVEAELAELKATMPATLSDVLEGEEYPSTLPVPDADFVVIGRKVDRVYQTAARFKALLPWLSYYKDAKAQDVRAYFYFRENQWSAERLKEFDTFSNELKEELRSKLRDLCLNSGQTELGCKRSVSSAERKKTIPSIFTRYMIDGEKTWDDFFVIPSDAVRSDVSWNIPERATIPFNTPAIDRFLPYLRDNIEDEFRFNDWGLKLRFGTFANGPRLKFETGVVPHVDRLGGNNIVMDSNQSIEEYESQWTIRHEFGHVIGLPDCYHEFYDINLGAFVNYQLDVDDLMCSRAGNMNERIYEELKRAYFTP